MAPMGHRLSPIPQPAGHQPTGYFVWSRLTRRNPVENLVSEHSSYNCRNTRQSCCQAHGLEPLQSGRAANYPAARKVKDTITRLKDFNRKSASATAAVTGLSGVLNLSQQSVPRWDQRPGIRPYSFELKAS